MKNYYYFLGINEDASAEDIKKAYRKLSMKYHPDKNDNDEFFELRFREVQEAYDTLIDEDKRRTYDHLLSQQQRSTRSNLPPRIKSFHANKIRVKRGEEVIITWQTFDADVVKIHPFGLEKAFGEKIIKIDNFDATGKYQLILNATNTLLNQTVANGITITEVSGDYVPESEDQNPIKAEEPKAEDEVRIPNAIKWTLLAILVVALLVFWFLKKP